MTNKEKECRIAKACGWKVSDAGWWSHEALPDNGGAEPEHPWYFSDLNACHEMEKALTEEQASQYQRLLEGSRRFVGAAEFWTYHATAAQRAEAFGLTLKLWT